MLLVSDPEMVKEIFIKEFSNFTNRPVSISTLGVIKLWISDQLRDIYTPYACAEGMVLHINGKLKMGKLKSSLLL